MQKTIKISLASFSMLAAGLVLLIMYISFTANAHEGEKHANEEAAQAHENEAADRETYVYQAQPGDTYSAMARKAVQTYGIDNKVNLSQAGIVFAETQITNGANAELLEVGQEVKISKDAVKKYAEEAEKLSDSQQKAWGYYVQFIDFNTDKVGQAS